MTYRTEAISSERKAKEVPANRRKQRREKRKALSSPAGICVCSRPSRPCGTIPTRTVLARKGKLRAPPSAPLRAARGSDDCSYCYGRLRREKPGQHCRLGRPAGLVCFKSAPEVPTETKNDPLTRGALIGEPHVSLDFPAKGMRADLSYLPLYCCARVHGTAFAPPVARRFVFQWTFDGR